ncbi:uncharacterized protein Z519_04213 [Cladophialophora bantiana CBS 173.52]|uniref:Uncharacterized protein n=1 Tax=Cladophialophora bantiana (strain ATCC 10958 / CBS 173.52 / CDC B-1940 / NIH 8579) TaxID=1442370 RepID=A0A0D2HQB4_CLAB1|nr:uncharacterized protein Z519_04213 [Cladophialophora bantiana CBS 173.52]KIW95628.1 hypothetical protein Z519_04213 [Cladophialophora bantiana CBS 173.52]
MAELDALIDSLIQQRNAPEASYIDSRYENILKVEQIPGKGQGVFAKQFLSVKDPICSLNFPAMMAIDSDFLPMTCYHCLVVTESPLPLPGHGQTSLHLKICNGCRSARFCSKDCQVDAWHAYHKYECKIFKKLQNNLPPAILRAVLRVVLLKDRDVLPSDEWSRISQLVSHEQILAARGRSNLTDMAEGIKHLAASSMGIETIQRLIFIMKANATELPTPIQGGIGVMLEPLVAKFNHSCEPNLAVHRPQHTMISRWMSSTRLSDAERRTFIHVIPLRDIQQGEELLNYYIVPTASAKARRAKLMADYFFTCNCPKCLSDIKAATDLAAKQPSLPTQFDKWTESVERHLAPEKRSLDAFRKAAAGMDKSERFLEYPALYTTGKFPEMAMRLILEGLKQQALDEAVVNVLRIYFLVNPQRLVGRHNPTNIYTIFIMLDILDAILGISIPSGVTGDKVESWLRDLSNRGLSKDGVIYWRHRICTDLRKRLDDSALTDLLSLVQKREEQAKQIIDNDRLAEGEGLKKRAEEEMRAVLGLKEQRWRDVMQETGC